MYSPRSRKIVTGILFFLIVLFSLLLYFDLKQNTIFREQEVIGNILYKEEVILRKPNGRVIWTEIETNMPVMNRDTIRTGNLANATISLKDGTMLHLDENTMFMLDFSGTKTKMDLVFGSGSITAKQKLDIQTKNQQVQIQEEGSIRFSKDKNLRVKVQKGSAVIKTNNAQKHVDNTQMAIINGNNIELYNLKIQPLYPEPNKTFVIEKGKTQNVSFHWKANIPAKKSKLEIAKNSKFTSKVKEFTTTKESLSLNLEEGIYYWRIHYEQKIENVPIGKFHIVRKIPFRLYSPPNNSTYTYFQKKPLIHVYWTPSKYAISYKLELSQDRNFHKLIKSTIVTNNEITLNDLENGVYYVRIHTNPGRLGIQEQTTSIHKFTIQKNKTPPSLTIPSHLDHTKIPIYNLQNSTYTLKWKDINDYIEYYLEIASDYQFQTIVYKKHLSKNFILIPNSLKVGKYYWRVRGITKNDTKSKYSVSTFQIVPNSIALISPKEKSTFKLDDSIRFIWKTPLRNLFSKIEISKHKNFQKIQLSQKQNNLIQDSK